MSAFDEPYRMGQALTDLRASNIALDALGVMGVRTALTGMQAGVCDGQPEWRQFLPLFTGIEPVPFMENSKGVFATSGRLITTVKKPEGWPAVPNSSGDCWIPLAQRNRLADFVDKGAVVLLANPSTQEQWVQSTRSLLQHSRHPVQSHEIALPPAGGVIL